MPDSSKSELNEKILGIFFPYMMAKTNEVRGKKNAVRTLYKCSGSIGDFE